MIHHDETLWWTTCGGNEAEARVIGPSTQEGIAFELTDAGCDHHHAVFSSSLRVMARRLPPDAHSVSDAVFCALPDGGHRTLIGPSCVRSTWHFEEAYGRGAGRWAAEKMIALRDEQLART